MKLPSWREMECLSMSLVEGAEDVQITVQLEDDTEYEVFVDDVAVGGMKTNMSGKLNCSVELNEGVTAKVKIVKR